jgi:hypothetical protein
MKKHLPLRLIALTCAAAGLCFQLATAQTAAPANTAAGGSADPRNFDAVSFGQPIPLGPNWLFAPGDNPAWASPAFDDSGWKTISSDKQLRDYGIHDIPYAWYRVHIHLRPGARSLTVGLAGVSGSYEVFANGLRIGGDGNMTGLVQTQQHALISYSVPDSTIAPSGNLVLAFRFALNRGGYDGLGASTPLSSHTVYLFSQWEAPFLVSYVVAHAAGPPFLLCCLALIAGLVSFALYVALRTQLEYLAISIYLFAASACMAVLIWADFNSSFAVYSLMWVALCVENFALIEFVRLVLHLPRTRWFLLLEVASSLAFFVPPANSLGIASTYVYLGGFYLPVLVVKIILPALLLRGFLRGNRDAGVLLPAILLGSLADYWRFLCDLISYAHFAPLYPFLIFSLPIGSYQIDFYRIGDLIFYIAVLLFLVLRTVGIARDRARAAAELEAARTTQQLLLSRSSHPTPGFHVESIYHPASEVGGDFFLVASSPGGGLIAIVGDVSGKGLIAAMRVAMILGVLRREDSWQPAQILHNLNEALLTRGEPGFTTACCVHIERSGRFTLANAGQIAPYIDGREIATPPALPLGLVPDQHYTTVSGNLSVNQRIVLLSDGVVEARSGTGELLGFERLARLTLKSAREIADTAKNFGQDDDITVLTLTRLTAGEDSTPLQTSPTLAPALP